MKHIKQYEIINQYKNKKTQNEPKFGDYVICDEDYEDFNSKFHDDNFKKVIQIIRNNIGQCIKRELDMYYIKYDNDILNNTENLTSYFSHDGSGLNIRRMNKFEIIYWSNNKKDLEPIIQANKYNL